MVWGKGMRKEEDMDPWKAGGGGGRDSFSLSRFDRCNRE